MRPCGHGRGPGRKPGRAAGGNGGEIGLAGRLLAGRWRRAGSGEQWSTAAGGTILGTSRTVKGGKTTAFEFAQIRLTVPGQLAYIVQPSGEPPVEFNLLRQDKPNEFVFANLDNAFPSRITYRHETIARYTPVSSVP